MPGLVMGNATLVTAPEVVLFDAGLPGEGPVVLRFLQSLGIDPRALTAIALTHADAGHAGGAPWLRRNSAARILCSPIEAEAAAGGPRGTLRWAWGRALALTGRPPERFAADGVLSPEDVLAGFAVVPTPGHTPGHVAFFRPEDGVLVAGDAVRVAGRDLLAPAFWDSASELTARRSVAWLADLSVRLLVPGHGPPYREPGEELRRVGGPPGFLEEQMRRRAARRRGRKA